MAEFRSDKGIAILLILARFLSVCLSFDFAVYYSSLFLIIPIVYYQLRRAVSQKISYVLPIPSYKLYVCQISSKSKQLLCERVIHPSIRTYKLQHPQQDKNIMGPFIMYICYVQGDCGNNSRIARSVRLSYTCCGSCADGDRTICQDFSVKPLLYVSSIENLSAQSCIFEPNIIAEG